MALETPRTALGDWGGKVTPGIAWMGNGADFASRLRVKRGLEEVDDRENPWVGYIEWEWVGNHVRFKFKGKGEGEVKARANAFLDAASFCCIEVFQNSVGFTRGSPAGGAGGV